MRGAKCPGLFVGYGQGNACPISSCLYPLLGEEVDDILGCDWFRLRLGRRNTRRANAQCERDQADDRRHGRRKIFHGAPLREPTVRPQCSAATELAFSRLSPLATVLR